MNADRAALQDFVAAIGATGTTGTTGGARSALAEATGACLAGERAAALVAAGELLGALDLLVQATERLAPLVVHVRGVGGDLACHAAADAGAVVLAASDAREVFRLGVLAHAVAERALVPVLVVWDGARHDDAAGDGAVAPLPDRAVCRMLLGDAGDLVPCPTPAQRAMFGDRRRRVPRWFDRERPALLGGVVDDAELAGARAAARRVFVTEPAAAVLQAAVAEAQAAGLGDLGGVVAERCTKARVVLVTHGAAVAAARAAVAGLRDVGLLGLRSLRPFPAAAVLTHLRGVEAAVVLDRSAASAAGEAPLVRELRALLERAHEHARSGGTAHPDLPVLKDKHLPRLRPVTWGIGGGPLRAADLVELCRLALADAPLPRLLGVDFTPPQDALPKQRAVAEAVRREHPGIDAAGLRAQPVPPPPTGPGPEPMPVALPAGYRARSGSTWDSLPRFWDTIGVAVAAGRSGAIAPDPCLAAGAAPALASWLAAPAVADQMPVFDPLACTGCGRCWVACPDAAIGVTALGIDALLEAGMAAAQAAGQSADSLRMIARKLTRRAAAVLQQPAPPGTAGPLLHAAFRLMEQKNELGKDHRASLLSALDAVMAAIGHLPVAATPPLFGQPEARQPGQGELLALAVDPDACKGCGVCSAVCAPGALRPESRTPERLAAGRAVRAVWQRLPDTRGATIARVRQLPEPGLAGGLQLSRHCQQALAGRDGAEPGSGARIAVRAVLAAVEAHLQPLLQQQLAAIGPLREQFGERIRGTLAQGLPGGDLDALAEGLAAFGRRDVELSALARSLEEVCSGGRVDAGALGRQVETARALADLDQRITAGNTGLGRARAGLVVAPGPATAWAAAFPWNPFAAPVYVDAAGAAAASALGLARGLAATVCADAHLLRRARLELEGRAGAAAALPMPRWHELTADERALMPPLVLLADGDGLAAQPGSLQQLLGSGLPVLVLLLDEADPLPRDAVAIPDLVLQTLLRRDVFVLQSTVARPDHLTGGVLAALRRGAPALVRVHAPSPARHGFAAAATLAQAELALASRALPLLRYDPDGPGVFGSRIDLEGNPQPGEPGATLADWALTEARFAAVLPSLPADAPQPTPLCEWLELAVDQRAGRTPWVGAGEDRRAVAPAMAAAADRCRQTWRTLQELAGLRTPFVARERAQAAAAVQEQHAAALAAQATAHQTALDGARDQVEQELLARLQQRLCALAEGRMP